MEIHSNSPKLYYGFKSVTIARMYFKSADSQSETSIPVACINN